MAKDGVIESADAPHADHFGFLSYEPPSRLTDTTRNLCAAAHLDPAFAHAVIREVVEDERRAVALSFGFDLNAVVRHCFHARERHLTRDGILFGLILLGLLVATGPTLLWLGLGLTMVVARSRLVRQLSLTGRALLAGSLLCLCGGVPTLLWTMPNLWVLLAMWTAIPVDGSELPFLLTPRALAGTVPLLAWAPLLLFGATLLVMVLFERRTHQILTDQLRPGQTPRLPLIRNERVARRVATISQAQYGNIALQEREPFLSCGKVEHGWSYVIPLRPAPDAAAAPDRVENRPSIDHESIGPALTAHIRAAVRRMRAEPLPKGARVPGLYLAPYVVADGVRRLDDPLLQPGTGVPYSWASDEVIEAVIRHPQGGMRYYDRMAISGVGKPIHTADGREVLPEQSLGIDISALVHTAVEGGMLYVEFLATVMPPVKARYMVDRLHREPSTRRLVMATLPRMLLDSTHSGWRLAKHLWWLSTMNMRMDDALETSRECRVHDYGARLSVRRLAAEQSSEKHLQLLDEWKYTKLLERAVLEAIVSFLSDNGLDTGGLAERARQVQNIFGDVNTIFGGQQAFASTQVTFEQRNQEGRQ